MKKRDEISDPGSCFNKATDDERLFLLLARDPAAPAVIRYWCFERVRVGRNSESDPQIRQAREEARLMDQERPSSSHPRSSAQSAVSPEASC
jgi:hypothetical protein